MKKLRFLIAVSLVALTASIAVADSEKYLRKVEFHNALKNNFKVGSLHTKTFSIETREDRKEFKNKLAALLDEKQGRMPEAAQLSLREAIRLLDRASVQQPSREDIMRLQESVEAYNSNFLSPVPQAIWIGAVPYEAIKMIHHSIMNKRAAEVADPVASSFWQPDQRSNDLYNGFGRSSIPTITGECKYLEPKKSYGVHGGFKMDCEGAGKIKIKFGLETKTEPFNSRIVWALGYNATPIDYIPQGAKVVYDRRAIVEYNSRKSLEMDFKSVLGFTYFKHNEQADLNPFDDAFIGAELVDGTFVPSAVLRTKLVKSIPQKKKKDDWGQLKKAVFNEIYEKSVKYLVLHEASLEGPTPKNLQEMGAWSWKSFDHPDRRELRGFGLFTAWINGFDMRQNNNKTFLQTNADGSTNLVQEVSDLGTGLGEASNLLHYHNGLFDKLPWDLVRLRAGAGDADEDTNEDGDPADASDWSSPYKFNKYSVIQKNPAFSNAQLSDAQWMVRKLASFSEEQIQDALVAAGLTATETKLVLEKLLDRRQQMVSVFGLAREFPQVMNRKINRELDFDPSRDAVPKAKGGTVAARITKQKIVNGSLIE